MSSTFQKLMIVLGVLALLAFLGYRIFLSDPDPVIIAVDSAVLENAKGQDILDLVDKLTTISIDQSIFASTLFTNLSDKAAIVTDEPQGKPNPFAPLSGSPSIPTAKPTVKIPPPTNR